MDERFLLALPVLVLSLGMWRPRLGLGLLAAALPLFGAPPAGPYLAALDLAGVASVAVALRASREHPGAATRTSALRWPVIAWTLVSVVSLIPLAYHPPAWRPSALVSLFQSLPHTDAATLLYSWRAAEKLLLGAALYWSYRRVFAGASLRPLAVAFACGLGYLVPLGLLEQLGLLDLSAYRSSGAEIYDLRLHSLFFHSGWLAQYVIIASPLALAGLTLGSRSRQLAASVLLGLLVLTLLLTQQRGAWIAAVAQLGCAGVLLSSRDWTARRVVSSSLVAISVLLVGGLLLGGLRPQVLESLSDRIAVATADLSGRWRLWQRSVDMADEGQFLGSGLGGFAIAYEASYPRQSHGQHWATAHSLYVHTLFERGALGLAALLLVVLAAAAHLRPALRGPPGERRSLALGLAISWVGLSTYGLVQYIFYLQNLEWLCWILLAATSMASTREISPVLRGLAKGIVVLSLLSVPLRLWLVEPPAGVDDRSFGFHLVERTANHKELRWTSSIAALRLPWTGRTLLVELADGHPLASSRSLEVKLEVDGIARWNGPLTSGWQSIPLVLGPPTSRWTVVTIRPSTTFRPYKESRRYAGFGVSRDIRSLGVAVGEIRWSGLLLEDHTVSGTEVHTDANRITAGDLGAGDYVVGASGHLVLSAPEIVLVDGFAVRGRLSLRSP